MLSLLYPCPDLTPAQPPLQPWKQPLQQPLTAETAVPSGLQEPGRGGDILGKKDVQVHLQVEGEGERYPTADGAAAEQKSPVGIGRCSQRVGDTSL